MLIETTDYKYFGVYFSRSLSFSYHINYYLNENFERKFNERLVTRDGRTGLRNHFMSN